MPDKRPETGWGEKLHLYFNENIDVKNFAVNGRSTKSFINEGRLDKVICEISSEDYLLIQFGHNDEKESPILHTDAFTTGKIVNTHANYPDAMKELGARLYVPVIDMTEITKLYFEQLGPEGSKKLFFGVEPNHTNYPEGVQDNTHFSDYGASQMARLVSQDIYNQKIDPLYKYLL